jgi:hypothetical protein
LSLERTGRTSVQNITILSFVVRVQLFRTPPYIAFAILLTDMCGIQENKAHISLFFANALTTLDVSEHESAR